MRPLLLVPTAFEGRLLSEAGLPTADVVGFGPIAAAAETARLIAERRPERAFLVGIAGSYDPSALPLGTATSFSGVACDGVGAGEGLARLGPRELGWPQLDPESVPPIWERLSLEGPGPVLLTACAASASPAQAEERRVRFGALAEDMEGFAVALACARAQVPLTVVRGLSNAAGDRDKDHWCIEAALSAAAAMTLEWLESTR